MIKERKDNSDLISIILWGECGRLTYIHVDGGRREGGGVERGGRSWERVQDEIIDKSQGQLLDVGINKLKRS